MSADLPLLRLEGDAGEMGLQHGRAAKALVAHNVRVYLQRFRDGGLSPEEIRRRAKAYLAVIEASNADYAAALAGVAEGSGQDLLDVVAVNIRYEIVYSESVRMEMERGTGPPVAGCTALAVLPERSANGHVLLAQNWDWMPEVRGVVLRARRGDGREVLAFTQAGIPGANIGLNSAGLGLAVNGLVSHLDGWSRLQKPFHVRCWEILASRTLEDALAAIGGSKRSCSSNFLLAKSAPGPQAVDVEVSPESECRLLPSGGLLVHTNHFRDPDALGLTQPLAKDWESTLHRLDRAERLLHAAAEGRGVTVEGLKRILRDHDGDARAICRHPDPARPVHERYITRLSAVMDLEARAMHVAWGNPCAARYRRLTLLRRKGASHAH